MLESYDLVINGVKTMVEDPSTGQLQLQTLNIAIKDGKIAALGDSIKGPSANVLNGHGLHAIPGLIDTQVHFREPGLTQKEDLASGTRAAIYGGVTTIFEMPNTKPPTLSALDVADKMSRAEGRAWCDYAFYVGASPDNADRLAELENLPGVCGVKMFMGSSTGNLFVGTDEVVRKVLQNGKRRMAVHCEDEARLKDRKSIVEKEPGRVELHPVWRDVESALLATKKLVVMAREAKRPVHVLHVTTAEEMEFLAANKDAASVEVTPQHLLLHAPECYERLQTLAQMNPPIRERRHQEALWAALESGVVDVIGSDHAPHLLEEKQKTYPQSPSGMPGVQTIAPLLLNCVNQGRLTLERFVQLTASRPAKLFGIKDKGAIRVGARADIALVDLNAEREIENTWIQSKCAWTPFAGMKVKGWVNATVLAGNVIYRDGELIGGPRGRPVLFEGH